MYDLPSISYLYSRYLSKSIPRSLLAVKSPAKSVLRSFFSDDIPSDRPPRSSWILHLKSSVILTSWFSSDFCDFVNFPHPCVFPPWLRSGLGPSAQVSSQVESSWPPGAKPCAWRLGTIWPAAPGGRMAASPRSSVSRGPVLCPVTQVSWAWNGERLEDGVKMGVKSA